MNTPCIHRWVVDPASNQSVCLLCGERTHKHYLFPLLALLLPLMSSCTVPDSVLLPGGAKVMMGGSFLSQTQSEMHYAKVTDPATHNVIELRSASVGKDETGVAKTLGGGLILNAGSKIIDAGKTSRVGLVEDTKRVTTTEATKQLDIKSTVTPVEPGASVFTPGSGIQTAPK